MEDLEKSGFTGLNQDSSFQDVEQGEYLDAQNIRLLSKQSNTGRIITNIEGNREAENPLLPAGTNICIGSFADDTANQVYYFIYNSNSDHSIYLFDRATEGITLLLQWSGLNFSPLFPINGCFLVNEKLLYFNDGGNNPPRRLNVEKIREDKALIIHLYFFERFTDTDPIDGYIAINVSGSNYNLTDGTDSFNFTTLTNVRATNLSDFVTAFNLSDLADTYTATVVENSYIKLTANATGYFDLYTGGFEGGYIAYQNMYYKPYREEFFSLIKQPPRFPLGLIERYVENTSDTDFSQAEENNLQLTYRFIYDDGEFSTFAPYTTLKIAKSVPSELYTIAKAQDIVPEYLYSITDLSEQWQLSVIKEVEIAIKYGNNGTLLSYRNHAGNELPFVDYTKFTNTHPVSGLDVKDTVRLYDSVPLLVKTMEIADNKIVLGNNTEGYDKVPFDMSINIEFKTNYNASIFVRPLEDLIYSIPGGTITVNSAPFVSAIHGTEQNHRKYLKRGTWRRVGVVFYDKYNRSSGVYTQENSAVYIPELWEDYTAAVPAVVGTPTTDEYNESHAIMYGIINTPPPDWATHYQWVVTQNLTYSYWDFFHMIDLETVKSINPDGTVNGAAVDDPDGLSYIRITDQQTKVGYVWQKGDKIKVTKYMDESGGSPYVLPLEGLYEIYGQYNGDWILTEGDIVRFVAANEDATKRHREFVVEIVRFTTQNDEKYFETGTYGEITGGGYGSLFSGNGQFIDWGDCYLGKRTYRVSSALRATYAQGTTPSYASLSSNDKFFKMLTATEQFYRLKRLTDYAYLEGESKMYYFETYYANPNLTTVWDLSIGRPNTVIQNEKQEQRKQSVRISAPFVSGSKINGLSTFEALDEKVYTDTYGELNKLIAVRNVLVALFSVEAISIYVGRTETMNTDGTSNLVSSENSLGSFNVLQGGYGCVHPQSAVTRNGILYWWSQNEKKVARYAGSGVEPISVLGKMHSYFRSLSPDIAIGMIDDQNEEYILTVDDETIAWNQARGRWQSFYTYVGENYTYLPDLFISFKDGVIYLHDQEDERNTFYGEYSDSFVDVLCNKLFSKQKIFSSISTESSEVWISTDGVRTIGEQLGDSQLSELQAVDFELKEGVYYAQFLRDKNTPNAASLTEALLNGDELRGYALKVKLSNSSTTITFLYNVNIGFNYSVGHLT